MITVIALFESLNWNIYYKSGAYLEFIITEQCMVEIGKVNGGEKYVVFTPYCYISPWSLN